MGIKWNEGEVTEHQIGATGNATGKYTMVWSVPFLTLVGLLAYNEPGKSTERVSCIKGSTSHRVDA